MEEWSEWRGVLSVCLLGAFMPCYARLKRSQCEPTNPLTPHPIHTHKPQKKTSTEIRAQLVHGLVAAAEAPLSPILPLAFLKSLLHNIGDDALPALAAPILSDLLSPLVRAQRLSDPGVAAHVGAIQLLVSQHKGCVEALVQGVANFTLPPQGVPMPTVNPRFPMMPGPTQLQRHGLAHESFTTLGVLFRLGFPSDDPQVLAQFENLRTRTRPDIDGKVNSSRALLQRHHAVLVDLLEAMLRAGGVLRQRTVAWLGEALALNVEAEKERPNPRIKSSDTFLLNLASVLLHMAGKFVTDPKKRAGANAGFLAPAAANGGAYPADTTRLKPAAVEGGEGEGEDAMAMSQSQEEFTFLTQCFFLAWRALHLGPVQCFGARTHSQRYLGHLQVRGLGVVAVVVVVVVGVGGDGGRGGCYGLVGPDLHAHTHWIHTQTTHRRR
jgi:hypothetical protein